MKVLFAVDLSEPESAVRQAEALASSLQAELLVLHVHEPTPTGPITPVDPMSGMAGFAPYAVYDPNLEEDLERMEADAFRCFLRRFRIPVRPASRSGDPAQMILQDAEEENADMIILGKRHQSRLQRWLVGSVATEVVERLKRPVILIPILEEQKQSGDA